MAKLPGLDRSCDRLDESLFLLKGLAAAVWCIGTVDEGRQAELPYLDRALSVLGELASAEVQKAEAASEEMWQELRAAKGFPEPEKRKGRARTG